MRAAGIPAVLGILACTLSATQAAGELQRRSTAPLNDTDWYVTLLPDADAKRRGAEPLKETISFNHAALTTNHLAEQGFGPASYSTTESFGAVSFRSKQTSMDHGKLQWTGEVSHDTVQGTLTWTKNDGTLLRYTFKGTDRPAESGADHE